ncbi:MAG: DUF3465 domain-containing protein [Candidatus Eremiobacteraeota bacterium]|nr:DUF3465 domain-containing protein [Candidatus Eremiobacteraeota bacterium]
MHKIAVLLALALPAGCAAGAPSTIETARNACARGASHVEIADAGRVVRYLGIRRSRHGAHEGFVVLFKNGETSTIEDNVDITGTIPIAPNDIVSLQGQYECNDGVIHWTHHDPSMRHQAGYVDVGGRRYQ